jgi:hypothetical protein
VQISVGGRLMQVNLEAKPTKLLSCVDSYRHRPARDVEFFTAQTSSVWHLHDQIDARAQPDISSSKCHIGEANMPAYMTIRKILAAGTALSLIAAPAIAQNASNTEKNGHHYQGGPKTEVPHHMGKKETVGVSTKARSGGHHYTGGPNTGVPHHMGEKQ